MPGTAPFCGNSGFSPWFWGSAHLPVCSSNILLLQPCLLGQLQCFLHPHLSPGTTFGIPSARVGQIRCLWRMPGLSHPVVWTTGACAAGDLLPGGGVPPCLAKIWGARRVLTCPLCPPCPAELGPAEPGGDALQHSPPFIISILMDFLLFFFFAACQLPFFIVS